jgi:DNA-directed RNA polymerase specialized sigma24 family protein
MVYHPMDTPCTNDGKPSTAPGRIPTERLSPVSLLSNPLYGEMSLPLLAAHCIRELNTYRRGEPCTDRYGIELLLRATVQGDQEAWAWVQHCFGGVVLNWLRNHPRREVLSQLDSEDNCVAQAFERFWYATACQRQVTFSSLAAALHYLRLCLNSTLIDTLRAHMRPREVPLSAPYEAAERFFEPPEEAHECWEVIESLLPNQRERRVAYLLFHCSLKPREIVRFCSEEFSEVREIYRLKRNILERLLHNADRLRWRLGDGGNQALNERVSTSRSHDELPLK